MDRDRPKHRGAGRAAQDMATERALEMTRAKWSDDEKQALAILWADNVQLDEIGKRLDRSKGMVLGQVKRMGLTARPERSLEWSAAQYAELAALRNRGLTPKRIAERLGKSIGRVRIHLGRLAAQEREAQGRDEIVTRKIEMNVADAARRAPRVRLPDRGCCNWPIGDVAAPDFRFCGAPVVLRDDGRSTGYCAAHYRQAHESKSWRAVA